MGTTTFLFVDQVGSTAQLTRLGDQAAQLLRRALFDTLRQATELAGGREVDFTGDGLFCAFDGAADAVDAAVAMQQLVVSFNARRPETHHLAIRIGLNTGEPLDSEGGGYFGAAVVVAARLCAAAAPGQVLATALVRGLVEPRGVHVFAPTGQLELKGVPAPVDAHHVLWDADERRAALPAALAVARRGPFVGRTRELTQVGAAWDRISDGGRALVLVSGDRGTGVSRLLAEAAEVLRGRGASVWAGAAQGPEARLAAWAEAIGQWADVTPRAELRLAVGERAADVARLLPAIAERVPRLPAPQALDPAAEVFLIADAVDELATRWSGVEPLVVVLDALDEADPATVTVLRRLAASRRGGRVLVLAGYEPAAVGASRLLAALHGIGGLVDLRLTGLTDDEVAQLLLEVTGEPAGEASLRGVVAESEGSPYFVLEMARSLKERAISRHVDRAVDRAAELRSDLRLQREEISLALRQLDVLRDEGSGAEQLRTDPDGTPPSEGQPPYRGLLAFQVEDADTFFGREALVAEMVAALASGSWLTVVGSSGSGKSSAVRAGLLPALARGALPGSDGWSAAVCTPGPDPLEALGAALAGVAAGDATTFTQRLASERLAAVAADATSGSDLVLVVDQFEELWTNAAEDARRRVLDLLVECADDPGQVRIVVCLRADHFGLVSEEPGVAGLLAEAQVVVSPMTTAELRAAVEQPARRSGWVLQPGLAQAVIDDVTGQPGALPLVSTAMLETWQRRRGRSLTLAGYAETGGARRAIATLADTTLDELSAPLQQVARRILLRLAAPAVSGGDVARLAPLDELVVDDDARAVLARLVDRRLVSVGATTAQVSHEALLREWPRLRSWLEADREGRRVQQQIAAAAVDWDAGGRDDGALLRGARLAAVEEWWAYHAVEMTELEQQYVTSSVRARRRRVRRLRALAGVLVVLLTGALVGGSLAVVNGRAASDRAAEATARGLAAQAAALVESQVDAALLLAVEGHRRDPSIDTQTGLLTALNGARFLESYLPDLPRDVLDLAESPDRERLAVLTSAGTLQLYDAQELRTSGPPLAQGIETPTSVEFSPDGRFLAYGDASGVHVLDADTGAPVGPAPGGGLFAWFSFSSDGSVLAVAAGLDVAPGVRVLETSSGKVLGEIPAAAEAFVAVRPGHDELVVTPERGRARRHRFDGTPIGPAAPVDVESSLLYTPDGSRLMAATLDSGQFLDAETLANVGRRFSTTGSRFRDGLFSANGAVLVISGDDGSLAVVDSQDGNQLHYASGLAQPCLLAFLSESQLLCLSPEGAARLDLADLSPIGQSTFLPGAVGHLALLPGGERVLAGSGSELLEVDAEAGVHPTGIDDLPVQVISVALSPDAERVGLVGFADEARSAVRALLVDRRSGDVLVDVPVVDEYSGGGGRVAFSPDGDRFAVGGSDGSVTVIDSSDGTVLVRKRLDSFGVRALVWSPEGQLLQGGQDGVFRVVDPDTLSVVREVALSEQINLSDITPVPGTALVATASEDGLVRILDPATGDVVGEPLTADGTQLQSVAISPDGRLVAAVSRDGALRLWDSASGRAVGPPLLGHDVQALAVSWLPDGTLLTGSLGGSLIAWRTSPDAWGDRACELAGRDMTRTEWDRYLPDEPYRRTCSSR